jgi:uncharacterized SAM-binding protein YcdF (DUF218 family)
MNFERPSEISEEDKEIRREVLQDLKEFGRGEAPDPKEDWDLIWVMSGPDIDIAEDFEKDRKVLFNTTDKAAEKDVIKKINESRERFETGIKIAKEVAALRLGKKPEEITLDDLKDFSPDIYWNGGDWQNDNLRQRIAEGFLSKYNFPAERVIVSPNLDINNTGDNFKQLEDSVIADRRKIIIVSDTYHLPRINMFLHAPECKIKEEDTVFYQSEPRRVPVGKALGEIKKVPKYLAKGILGKKKK